MSQDRSISTQVGVVLFGAGTVAESTLRLCRTRPWLLVLGGVRLSGADDDHQPHLWNGAEYWTDPDALLDSAAPAVALMATRSSIEHVMPDIERCARRGVTVVCTSEELAWPDVTRKDERARLQALCTEMGCSIVATGINPGFIFDALPLTLCGGSWDVESIRVARMLDASVFGRGVHRSLGIGYARDDFDKALATGQVRGHIGFEESANLIAHEMGVTLDRFEESLDPVVAEKPYELREYAIRATETAGIVQRARAWAFGRQWIQFDLSLHVAPTDIGWKPLDRVAITGQNTIEVEIDPGTHAVRTTAARLVNAIPLALASRPGFYSSAQLAPAPPWLADRYPR